MTFAEHKADIHGNKYEVISTVAYLVGVPEKHFRNPVEPPDETRFDELETDKNARIIRNLCVLRTACIKNFGRIDREAYSKHRNITSMTEWVPQDAVMSLFNDGVDITTAKSAKKKGKGRGVILPPPSVTEFIATLNRQIADRMNNVRSLLPIWLNWDYIRDLFNMGTDSGTIHTEKSTFYENMRFYPYQVYLHWAPSDVGNLFYNDSRFVTVVYEMHGDTFGDASRVKTVEPSVKNEIYSYIEGSEKIVMVVDCENSDAYRLCATLQDMNEDMVDKISKIVLCDDENFTPDAWRIFQEHVNIPVEHIFTERVNRAKSLVDIKFTAAVCREHYQSAVDSFIIVSSDSDYYGLIDSLPDARFLVMVEHEKVGAALKRTLNRDGIFYCYIDDFYSGSSLELETHTLVQGILKYLTPMVDFNAKALMKQVCMNSGIHMAEEEQRQFYDRYLKNMKLVIAENGDVSIAINPK